MCDRDALYFFVIRLSYSLKRKRGVFLRSVDFSDKIYCKEHLRKHYNHTHA